MEMVRKGGEKVRGCGVAPGNGKNFHTACNCEVVGGGIGGVWKGREVSLAL